MKDKPFIIWLRDALMTSSCWINNHVVAYGCTTDERWLLDLGWWLEAKLQNGWWNLYVGSSEELADALDGRPLDHMTARQQAYYIAVMAQGGHS